MTHFKVETRKFRIKSSVALCSVDSWVLVHYVNVGLNLKFNLTTTIMFVVIIKLPVKSLLVVTHTYTIANAIVPMKLRPILTGQSQITACERKLLFVKETFESKNLHNV